MYCPKCPDFALSTIICSITNDSVLSTTTYKATREGIIASEKRERLVGSKIQPFFFNFPANGGSPLNADMIQQ